MGGTFSGCRITKSVWPSRATPSTPPTQSWGRPTGTNRSSSLEWRRGNEVKPSSSVSYTITVADGSDVRCDTRSVNPIPLRLPVHSSRRVATWVGYAVVHLSVTKYGVAAIAGAEAVPDGNTSAAGTATTWCTGVARERQPGLRGTPWRAGPRRAPNCGSHVVSQLAFALKC